MRKLLSVILYLLLCPVAFGAQVRDVYPEAAKLYNESRWAEAVSLCLEGLAQEGLPESGAVELYSVLGASYARLGAFGKAAEYMKKCYEYDLANGEKKGLTSSLINLASMYVYSGEPEKGEAYALEAVANEVLVGRPDYLAKACGKACDVYHALGKDSTALLYADRAVEIAESELDEVQVAIRRSQRAYALGGLGRDEEALDELNEAEKILRAADARQPLSVVRFQQAQEHGKLGNLTAEMECLQEAQNIASEIRDLPLLQKIAEYETSRREGTIAVQDARLSHERRVRTILILALLLVLAAASAVAVFAARTRRSERKLKESNDQKDFLFRVISHDMKSPAVAQLTGIQMLRRNIRNISPEDFENVLSQIELQAGAEVELIENSMRWATRQSSTEGSEDVRFNLCELARETAAQYKQPAEIKGIAVKVESDGEVFVTTDRSSLALALRNLLSNAIKFSSKGNVVTIRIDGDETAVSLSVSDQGVGIDPRDLEHIFDPGAGIRRSGTAGEPSNGPGLAVSKVLLEELGCALEASSIPGKGSTFTIKLPNALS